MIKNNIVNESKISNTIVDCLNRGADIIILGCTHYHWIKPLIERIVGNNTVVLEPSEAIARRVRVLIDLPVQ